MIAFTYNDAGGNRVTVTDQRLTFRGQWSASASYFPLDWVRVPTGESFIALATNTNVTPTPGASWALLVPHSFAILAPGASEVTATVLPFQWTNGQLLDVKVIATGTNFLAVNGTTLFNGTINGTAQGNVGVLIVIYGST
jgi:hypothetical protein